MGVLLVAGIAALAGAASGAGMRAESAADEAVLRLLAEDLDAQRARSPLSASRQGDRRWDHLLGDASPEAFRAYIDASAERLHALEAIDLDALNESNRTSALLLRHELRLRIAGAAFEPWQVALTQMSGPQIELPQLPDTLSFTRPEHYESYVVRVEKIPAYLGQIEANLRAGVRAGRTPARVVMESVPAQALAQGARLYEEDPTRHVLYRPFIGRDDALAARARRAIGEGAVPAFRGFGEFLRDEYVPGCRESLGAKEGPDGIALYEYALRYFTTLDLTVEDVHAIGLEEVARIRAEMMEVIARSDFANTEGLEDDALFEAFVAFLREDPRFYHESEEALLAGYRDIAKLVDGELPALFGVIPRLPYGVRPMPRFMAASAPTAYYYPGSLKNGVAGFFVANTHRLESRPKYEMIALTLHEAVPGHHFQIALAQELEEAGLPEWRTTAGYTAFVEGWALYAERLGLEMGGGERGLYADPYDDFGRLSYEMWRAMRLVVDTGIHAMGWSRERAIAYMLANSALTRENIEREVDRYIAWPGQATAYKIGELHIRALRGRAERELGDRFDIRSFHDAVLGQGAVPLEVLTLQIERWIGSVRAE